MYLLGDWSALWDRYPGCALATSLLNAGAALCHISLSSTALGLNSCAFAARAAGLIRAVGLDEREWGQLAAVAVGAKE